MTQLQKSSVFLGNTSMAQHHATLTMPIQFVKSYNDFMWLMKSSDMPSDSAGQCMIYKNIEKVTGEVCITRLIKWKKTTKKKPPID